MSPASQKILMSAYDKYQKTHSTHYSFVCHSGRELFDSTNALRQLFDNGYIENVSEFIFSNTISNSQFNGPIEFDITYSGIELLRSMEA